MQDGLKSVNVVLGPIFIYVVVFKVRPKRIIVLFGRIGCCVLVGFVQTESIFFFD